MSKSGVGRLSLPTAAFLSRKKALADQRDKSDSSEVLRRVRPIKREETLCAPTESSVARRDALHRELGQIDENSDPFWSQRPTKSDFAKGKTFTKKVVSKPFQMTVTASAFVRERVLCGREKLEWERKQLAIKTKKWEAKRTHLAVEEQVEQVQDQYPLPATSPPRGPRPSLIPRPPSRQSTAGSVLPPPAPTPSLALALVSIQHDDLASDVDSPSAVSHAPSPCQQPCPPTFFPSPLSSPTTTASTVPAADSSPITTEAIKDIEAEIRAFYSSPTPGALPRPFMLAALSPLASPSPSPLPSPSPSPMPSVPPAATETIPYCSPAPIEPEQPPTSTRSASKRVTRTPSSTGKTRPSRAADDEKFFTQANSSSKSSR